MSVNRDLLLDAAAFGLFALLLGSPFLLLFIGLAVDGAL